MKENKYYIIKDESLAITISHLTHMEYYIFDDRFDKTKKVYSFENTDKLKEILTLIKEIKNKYIK